MLKIRVNPKKNAPEVSKAPKFAFGNFILILKISLKLDDVQLRKLSVCKNILEKTNQTFKEIGTLKKCSRTFDGISKTRYSRAFPRASGMKSVHVRGGRIGYASAHQPLFIIHYKVFQLSE